MNWVWQFFAAPREAKAATEAMERMLNLTILSVEDGVEESWVGVVR